MPVMEVRPSVASSRPRILEVKLICDHREIVSQRNRAYITDLLRASKVPMEVRNMNLGDFVWVGIGEDGMEYMLDYVIDR